MAAVQETQIPGDGTDQNRNPYYWNWNETTDTSHERDEIVVDTLTEIPVTVRLLVRFEIAEGTTAPATTPADAGTKAADASAKDVSVSEVVAQ